MNEIIYNAYYLIQNILQNKMQDVNPFRNSTNQRFVYPTLPTSLDNLYPRITIKMDEMNIKPVGANNVIYFDKTERCYGLNIDMLFRIMIFIKKETLYPIELNGKAIKAKNELLVQNLNKLCYLTLFDAINSGSINREGFWINSVNDLSVTPGNFEFDTHRIGSEISIRINGIETTSKLFSEEETIEKINNTIQLLMNPEA